MNRALGVLLLAAGCCSGPDYRALAGDPAFRIDAAESFALVAPVVDDAARWGFGAPAPAVSALADRYRPRGRRRPRRWATSRPRPRPSATPSAAWPPR